MRLWIEQTQDRGGYCSFSVGFPVGKELLGTIKDGSIGELQIASVCGKWQVRG